MHSSTLVDETVVCPFFARHTVNMVKRLSKSGGECNISKTLATVCSSFFSKAFVELFWTTSLRNVKLSETGLMRWTAVDLLFP